MGTLLRSKQLHADSAGLSVVGDSVGHDGDGGGSAPSKMRRPWPQLLTLTVLVVFGLFLLR